MTAEPARLRFRLLEGLRPPGEQVEAIRDLLLRVRMFSAVDDCERMRRAELVARAVYERVSQREVERVWDYCLQRGKNPAALFAWKIKRLLGGWPW